MRVWVVACLMTLVMVAGCIGEETPESNEVDSGCPGDDHAMGAMDTDEPADDAEEAEPGDGNDTATRLALRQADGNESDEADDDAVDEGAETTDDGCPGSAIGIGAGVSVTPDATEGTVPFDVVFDLDAFEIPLDENLTWTLDVDGDGAEDTHGNGHNLPGNFTTTYGTEGTYEVLFVANYGDESWNATATITALPAAEPEPEVPAEPGEPQPEPFGGIDESIFVDSTCGVACTFGGADAACIGFRLGMNGLDCAFVEIPEGAWGQKFTVSSDWVDVDPDAAAFDFCGEGATEIDTFGAVGPEAGTIPPGTGCLVGWEFTGPASTIHFFVEPAF